LLHLVGDLFELYDDARAYKPYIYTHAFLQLKLNDFSGTCTDCPLMVKHNFMLVDTLVQKTMDCGYWKPPYFPWNTVTLLEVGAWCVGSCLRQGKF